MSLYVLKGRVINAVDDEPLENGVVAVRDDKIEYVGLGKDYNYPSNAEIIHVENGTILPGFMDCHCHLGSLCGKYDNVGHLDKILEIAHAINNLLDCGFTSVRDMSIFGAPLKRAIEKGIVRGPRIMPGGRVLSILGGHGDMRPDNYPLDFYNEYNPICCIVNGVDECLKAVRNEFRNGAEFIKVCVSGGVSSPKDKLNDVQFSHEELKVIVEEAKRHGTYVAAHCSSKAGVLHALKAGITSIEHAIDVDDECIELMKKLDATVVATLTVSIGVAKQEDLPEWMSKKAKEVAKTHVNAIKRLKEEGIRIAYGLDFTEGDEGYFTNSGKEFETLVKEAGFTPMEAIKAGTINSAHLMKMEDKIGSLEVGKLADIVVVEGNPLEDISILKHKDNIKVVLKEGKIMKQIK